MMANERPPLEEMTLRQLRKVASDYNISRYSRMRKSQLLDAIRQAVQAEGTNPEPASRINSEPVLFSQPSQETPFINPIQTNRQEEQQVEASKFELGQEDQLGDTLASVDEGLGELHGGYGESRVVLLPRDPQWAYTYWDIPNERKEEMRRQGGQQLALRIYDVTEVDLDYQSPHSVQEYICDELAREWYLPVPVSDRDYIIDIGYRCADGRWLMLARSTSVRIPPVYPSDWVEDIFITVGWDEELIGQTKYAFVPPSKRTTAVPSSPIYEQIFGMSESVEAQRIAGSLFGSMQHVAGSVVSSYVHQESSFAAVSSYVFPSGAGMWASGSGVGFSASAPPVRPRKFWLVADAELIVYGATEPDATVTVGGRPIKLNPDGTFRFQMSFQDGLIDYPIAAVAADGEQTRSIHMKFNRETPSRHTNTKEEAVLEWLT